MLQNVNSECWLFEWKRIESNHNLTVINNSVFFIHTWIACTYYQLVDNRVAVK